MALVAADPWQRRFRSAAPTRRVPPDPWQRQFVPEQFPKPSRPVVPWTYQAPPSWPPPDVPEQPRALPAFNFNTDPGYIAALAAEQAGRGSLDALLRQRRAEALIGFGDPEWAASSGFGLDPNAIEATRAMYRSGNATLARLEKGRADRRSALINRLAARNILFSGDLGYQERENEAQFGRERFDAQQQVLGYLREQQDQVLAQQQALRNAVVQSLQSAYQNYLANPYLYAGVG